jgi:hypothetical protein
MLIALIVVLATGFVHGLWTNRWQSSAELEAAVARLDHFPATIGSWQGKADDLDPDLVRQAGAAGARQYLFTHRRTRAGLTVILLCGRPGPISVHRPEHCYQGAGYDLTGSPVLCKVPVLGDSVPAEFWTAKFRKQEDTGPVQLRIFWSWYAGGAWKASKSPRLEFARYPVLYKLYVIHEITGPEKGPGKDPAVDFLRQLIPVLGKTLSPPA